MVGLEAHGEVVRSVFEEEEEEGGGKAGQAPKTPNEGILRRGGGLAAGKESKSGGDGGGGEGEVEDGGAEPEGGAAEEAGEEKGESVAAGGRSEAEGGEKERKGEGGGDGDVESVVVGTEGVEVPEEHDRAGKGDERGKSRGNAFPKADPTGRGEKKPEEGEEDAAGEFKGGGGRDADGFKCGGEGAESPDGELGPVDGAAKRGVVHVGVAYTEVRRFAKVAGVGEPSIGVGVDEEAGSAPGGSCGDVGRVGGGTFGEKADGTVEEDGHAREPKSENKNGPVAEEAHGKVSGVRDSGT